MNPVSNKVDERARKMETKILRRLESKTQTALAIDMNVSEAKISRFKNEYLPNVAKIFAILGFKLADDTDRIVSQDDWVFYQKAAFKAIAVNLNIDVDIN